MPDIVNLETASNGAIDGFSFYCVRMIGEEQRMQSKMTPAVKLTHHDGTDLVLRNHYWMQAYLKKNVVGGSA